MYYSGADPCGLTEDMILEYLLYLVKTLGCSRVKCKMAAQSISFFLRHVARRPYVIPSVVYPRKTTKLPPVMTQEEIAFLLCTVQNLKHRTILMMLYSTGMRVSEIINCRITDIDSRNMRIKVVQGKGAKDRFTVLSEQVLQELRAYYIIYKPKEYLFNGPASGKPYSIRSIQQLMQKALVNMGLNNKSFTVHTIRHSFATHLVDNGTDLHTVKELLGHSSLQTTMQYMHLSPKRIERIVNPYDVLPQPAEDHNLIKKHKK